MKKNLIAAAVAALVLPAAAVAGDKNLSYTYGELGYVDMTLDFAGDPAADGFGLDVSYEFTDMLFGFVEYADLSGDFDYSQMEFGIGAAMGLTDKIDGYAKLGFVDVDYGIGEDDGFGLEAGVRGMVSEQFELFGNLQYVDLTESDTGFEVGGRYWFQDNFGASISMTDVDGDQMLEIAARYEF